MDTRIERAIAEINTVREQPGPINDDYATGYDEALDYCLGVIRLHLSEPAPEHPIIKELEEFGRDLADEPDEGSQKAAEILADIITKHKGALRMTPTPEAKPVDWHAERCGHNFTPENCPHDHCGYREALARIEELSEAEQRDWNAAIEAVTTKIKSLSGAHQSKQYTWGNIKAAIRALEKPKGGDAP
jgi:hypothetical protein